MQKQKTAINDFRPYIRKMLPKARWLFLAMLLVLLESGMSLIVPIITMKIIDSTKLDKISLCSILVLVIVFFMQLVASFISTYILVFIGQFIVMSIRKLIWEHVLKLTLHYFDNHMTGELMSRITNDTLLIKSFMADSAGRFLNSIVSFIGSVVLLFILDWKIAFLMTISIPVTVFIVMRVGNNEYHISRLIQDETASFQSELHRVLNDIRLVKTSVTEKQESMVGSRIISKLYILGIKEGRLMAIVQPFTKTALMMLLVLIFGYGSIRVNNGSLSAGILVASICYLFQLINPCANISGFYAEYQKFLGAMERIVDILRAPEENYVKNNQNMHVKSEVGLRFKNVSFSYSGTESVLSDLNINFNRNEVTAIVGLSGAGKTTIFSLIEQFYLPVSGHIQYDGINISEINLGKWRKQIAYVSQDVPIMYGTIYSNLVYGAELYTEEEVLSAASSANVDEFVKDLPDKYNTVVGERGITLSGGQRQRISIARAMIRNPEILLLDEASAHLDSSSEIQVKDSFDKLMAGRTTVVIAHRLSTFFNADKIVVLEKGKITGVGKHMELLNSNQLYKKLVDQQINFSNTK